MISTLRSKKNARRLAVVLAIYMGFSALMDESAGSSKRSLWTFNDRASNEAWELESSEQENDGEAAANSNEKPIIYTFYEPTPEWTGMNLEGEARLLELWQKSWEGRGWETRVLNRDDAMKHPDFGMLEGKLQDLGVGAYNRVCYYRWLAMASIAEDSGWMSDYDLFPLNFSAERGLQMENDESFKSFSLHVPCLMHATRDDWNRVIHLMIEALPSENDGFRLISDMLSLRDVKNSEGIEMSSEVLKKIPYIRNDEGNLQLECTDEKYLAVHMSPFECSEAFKQDRYPHIGNEIKDGSDAVLHRAEAATKLMNDYSENCVTSEG